MRAEDTSAPWDEGDCIGTSSGFSDIDLDPIDVALLGEESDDAVEVWTPGVIVVLKTLCMMIDVVDAHAKRS